MKKIRLLIPILLLSTAILFAQKGELQTRPYELIAQTTTPVPVQISENIANVEGTYYYLHSVERGQTLFSIARTYQVTTGEIKRTIDKPEIQIGEILMVPVNAKRLRTLKRNHALPLPEALPETNPENDVQQPEPETEDRIRKEFNNPPKTTLNVALMLPLYLNEVEQIRINPRDTRAPIPTPFRFISFYEGATLAAHAFETEQIKINVHVFDVTEDENTATNLINSGRLNDVDIIIGPLFARSFRIMSDYAKQQEIFIINPLSERGDILIDNPYVIKINPSERIQLHTLLAYITKDQVEQQIFIVSNDSLPTERERSEQARLFFETYPNDFYTPVFIDISRDRFQALNNHLSNTERNAIVYLSNNAAFVTQILTQVSKRENPAGNVLYSVQRLPQFDFTEIQYLNDLQTHYVDPFFVDFTNEQVRSFERLFFETFQTIPDNNAYIGYNVMGFVLSVLAAGNTNYGNYLETFIHRSFPNRIRLQRADPTQGLENQETNILKIESSQLRKVNN
jgi:LysM repeat protein